MAGSDQEVGRQERPQQIEIVPPGRLNPDPDQCALYRLLSRLLRVEAADMRRQRTGVGDVFSGLKVCLGEAQPAANVMSTLLVHH